MNSLGWNCGKYTNTIENQQVNFLICWCILGDLTMLFRENILLFQFHNLSRSLQITQLPLQTALSQTCTCGEARGGISWLFWTAGSTFFIIFLFLWWGCVLCARYLPVNCTPHLESSSPHQVTEGLPQTTWGQGLLMDSPLRAPQPSAETQYHPNTWCVHLSISSPDTRL